MDGSVKRAGEFSFDEPIQSCRGDGVCRRIAINVSMIPLPFDRPALANNLARAVRFPFVGEPTFPLFQRLSQETCDGTERQGRVRPDAARKPVSHTQVAPFKQK